MPAIPCDGHLNIPDGEVYTAPVRDSVNGTITYNTKSTYQGVSFENISFTFQNGKIVKATSAIRSGSTPSSIPTRARATWANGRWA